MERGAAALDILAARFLIHRLPGIGVRAAFLLLLSASQYLLLSTGWPVHTRQDLLPFCPLSTVLLAGALFAWSAASASSTKGAGWR